MTALGFIILGSLLLFLGLAIHLNFISNNSLIKLLGNAIIVAGTILVSYIAFQNEKNSSQKTEQLIDITKRIKHPMPDKLSLSYTIHFNLNVKEKNAAESLISGKHNFKSDNPGAFYLVDNSLIDKATNWDWMNYDWIEVTFSKKFTLTKTESSSEIISYFSNFNDLFDNKKNLNKTLYYNPIQRIFLLKIQNAELPKVIMQMGNLDYSLMNESIYDLSGSTLIFKQKLPKGFDSIQITNFIISSKELNLHLPSLKHSENELYYIAPIEISSPTESN